MIKMNNWGSTGITSVILLISFILIAVTVASVLTGGTVTNGTSEEDLEQILNEVLDEITTYIQIKDKIGKYYGTYGNQKIEKIAILIKPLVSQEINISELTIKLCNGNNIKILDYSGNTEDIGSNHFFEHPIWDDITVNNFGFIVTHDKDNSLKDYNTINENTDMAYIIIKLSEGFTMTQGENLVVTLFPSTGLQKTTVLEAPLPMKPVVSFE